MSRTSKKEEKIIREIFCKEEGGGKKRSETGLLEMKNKELDNFHKALINILEDADIARKKAFEERNKTISLLSDFPGGVLVFDENNNLFIINSRAEGLLGFKKKELLGKNILDLEKIPRTIDLFNLLGKDIKKINKQELNINNGSVLEVSSNKISSWGSVIILHDITREKKVEKLKTEFVSIVAHQLRTPLSAIKWISKDILDGDFGEVTPKQYEFIDKINKSTERMITLVNDLLNVTQIEEKLYILKPVSSDFSSIVEFCINSYEAEAKKKNITLEFIRPSEEMPKIIFDVEKIKIAIQNFIDNSIKYNLPGGRVTVLLKYDKKQVELSVKDTGIGIPKTEQRKLFSKFYRGIGATKIETDGSGLGLFISKKIIEAHGGKVWCKSENDKGSTFYITMPAKEEFREFIKSF